MGLSRMAVKRPVATATILILVLLIGLVSLYQSPLDLLPDIQPPVLAVITAFPGSSPQETLELVTEKIENEVSAVSGLTNLNSISQEGLSLVIMQFNWGMNVKEVREDVNVRMDLIDLPDDVRQPMLLEFDPTLMPIMMVSASGTDDRVELTEWLNETASPRLESISGVASVQVQGGAKQDVFVRTSPEVMDDYQVSFDQIANVLQASLVDLPAGIIDLEERRVRIRFLGRYAETARLADLVVGFQVDEKELEKMIGEEIDIDLNQMLAGQSNPLSGSGRSSGGVPMREIYWDDYFDFDRGAIASSELHIPIDAVWADENAEDIEDSLRLFTANPNITYDKGSRSMVLSLSSLGRKTLSSGDSFSVFTDDATVRLEDVWIIAGADWDGNQAIIPVDPLSLDRYDLTESDLGELADQSSLITAANSRYVLVAFHENWENIRRDPVVQLPDYGAWLSNVQSDMDRGIDDASRFLEESLQDLAASTIQGSMASGGSGPGMGMDGLDFGDDFPINPVSLGMIAEIKQDTYSPDSITRHNQEPSISLVLQKEGDANTVRVAGDVREALDQLTNESAGNLSQINFDVVFDQAEEIEYALADLAWALAGGAVLAIIVLLLFLKNWRTTMFIGLSIPAAIIFTFSLLYFADITINLMTLGALALAAGMLVDNSIVVSENIYRHYQLGKEPADAAIDGAREVAGAVTASTLTTISVFFPVVFLTGLAGELFWEFALTVACAILASLVVALTVIPLLASRSLRKSRKSSSENSGSPRLPTYRRLLNAAVGSPWWVIIFAVVFVAAGALGFTTLGTELFPPTDESAFSIDITLPPGSTLEKTDDFVTEVENILAQREIIDSFDVQVGGGGFMGMGGGGGNSNQADIRVEIDPERIGEIDRVIEEVREEAEALSSDVELSFSRESLLRAAGLETTLDLDVTGDDLARVTEINAQAAEKLSDHPNFTDVQSSLEDSRPEVHIRLDQSEALQLGVTQYQVAGAVRQALEGIPVSRIETDDGIFDIILGYEKSDIKTVEDLGRIGFYTPNGEYLYLEDIAELTEDFGPQSIPRENQKIVGQIQIQYRDTDLGTATEEALEELSGIALPDGYEIKPSGSFSMMEDVLSELELVVVLAALLVYLVMAAQFESLLHPFIIILSLPMAFAGSIIALMITGNSLSVPAMIGVVVLSGILVNDGIIMVDYINQQRRIHGLRLKEAVVEGAAARLRPILMTTATTGLGLLPLALGIGEGSQLQAPMAITIIGGQITGTLLLLLAIPSIYMVLTKEKGIEAGDISFSGHSQIISPAADWSEPFAGAGSRRIGKIEKPLIMVILRMAVVIILMAVILILFNLSGQDLVSVIH